MNSDENAVTRTNYVMTNRNYGKRYIMASKIRANNREPVSSFLASAFDRYRTHKLGHKLAHELIKFKTKADIHTCSHNYRPTD